MVKEHMLFYASEKYPLEDDYMQYLTEHGVASVIGNYGWRDIVVICIDDDYIRNGISALSNEFETVRAKIVSKIPLSPRISSSKIASELFQLALMKSWIFVVHMNSDTDINIFSEALCLGMLSISYVWIATNWLSYLLDSNIPDYETMNSLRGVIGLRRHIPLSNKENAPFYSIAILDCCTVVFRVERKHHFGSHIADVFQIMAFPIHVMNERMMDAALVTQLAKVATSKMISSKCIPFESNQILEIMNLIEDRLQHANSENVHQDVHGIILLQSLATR